LSTPIERGQKISFHHWKLKGNNGDKRGQKFNKGGHFRERRGHLVERGGHLRFKLRQVVDSWDFPGLFDKFGKCG